MQRGFSLVELSIVLVILGLLTGGILGGQSLIRAAEMRAVSTEYNRYVAAAQTFRDKYFALPGDMTNAQSFWGVAHATPATCRTTVGTGTQTCNGDGDGSITPNTAPGSNESFRFWQHLANAGLIEGTYSGVRDGTTVFATTATNAPRSKTSNGLWYIMNFGIDEGSPPASQFAIPYDNTFMLGGLSADAASRTPIFKPEELWNIDTKMDDGRPAQGKVIARTTSTVSRCTTAASNTDLQGDYKLSDNSVQCTALFRQVF
ncbi:MAG: hypothetical protein DI582_09180 [Azospirillum brasilense]|nr:MAG: hypothetical protein DI582_09180 [Azospirillum brasilense]